MIYRKCTVCKEEKPANLEFFPPHKIGKHGLHSWCIPCKKAKDKARRGRPDQKARQKAWRDANKEKIREYNLKYRADGYVSTKDVYRWRINNLEHARASENKREKERLRTVPWYNLKCRISKRLNLMLKGGKQSMGTFEILGYTAQDLCDHIERQFVKGMGWHNMSEWEIDHIIPVAHFKADEIDSDDFRACWALSNLRPMWKSANRSKGAKIETLL